MHFYTIIKTSPKNVETGVISPPFLGKGEELPKTRFFFSVLRNSHPKTFSKNLGKSGLIGGIEGYLKLHLSVSLSCI